jgi:hypothetical protein
LLVAVQVVLVSMSMTLLELTLDVLVAVVVLEDYRIQQMQQWQLVLMPQLLALALTFL